MNYLAHLYLADRSGTSMAGALMGDFVQGRLLPGRFPDALQRGIRLHRSVDSFTDAHTRVLASRRRLRPPYRRFAGILIDVFYDHFLACDWLRFHRLPLPVFASRSYRRVARQSDYIPASLAAALPRLRRNQVLESYRHRAGLERCLGHLSRRFPRANPMAEGLLELDSHYEALQADFRVFFPQLEMFVLSEAHRLAQHR